MQITKSWLIEINTNPCLEESSPLLETLIPRMINDALRLTVDLTFGPEELAIALRINKN